MRRDLSGAREGGSFYRIEFDMLKKGSVLRRRGKPIKQFAVTVHTSTRVVTSGDVVDRDTYDALVAAGAVDPIAALEPMPEEQPSSTVPFDAAPPIDDTPEE